MTEDMPGEAETRIKKMYPHLYSRTSYSAKLPSKPERKENRRKNVRNFFGAKTK